MIVEKIHYHDQMLSSQHRHDRFHLLCLFPHSTFVSYQVFDHQAELMIPRRNAKSLGTYFPASLRKRKLKIDEGVMFVLIGVPVGRGLICPHCGAALHLSPIVLTLIYCSILLRRAEPSTPILALEADFIVPMAQLNAFSRSSNFRCQSRLNEIGKSILTELMSMPIT
jgi:hypothetical protein